MSNQKLALEQLQDELALVIDREISEEVRRAQLRRRLLWLVIVVLLGIIGLTWGLVSTNQPNQDVSEESPKMLALKKQYLSKAADYQFLWTWEDYQSINVAISDGQMTLDEIIRHYGKPSHVRSFDDGQTLIIDYEGSENLGEYIDSRVTLEFNETTDGYVLKHAHFVNFPLSDGLEITTNPDGLVWTIETIDQVTVASGTDQVGDSLESILSTFQPPSQMTITAITTSESRSVILRYTHIPPREGEVKLTFREDETGIFRLVDRYTSFYAGN